MIRIDAHQHFWKYDPLSYGWIKPHMQAIAYDFLPHHLKKELEINRLHGSIAVQALQTEKETEELIQLAAENNFVKGVIGWTDLLSDLLEERLTHYASFEVLRGFRHVLQDETNRSFMLTDGFKSGIRMLSRYGYTYDLLVYPDQIGFATQLAKEFPEATFILDHAGKPSIRTQSLEQWEKDLHGLASCDNVSCKISGLVTEDDWKLIHYDHFIPYLDVITTCFGTHRIMFGSDWPVCLLASTYRHVVDIATRYFEPFSQWEKDLIFGGNAIRIYKLSNAFS